MDTKALAKSKRAHSQHHSKKHHPNQTSKTPSAGIVGATSGKKPPGKQVTEKSHKSQGFSALPSNWHRYDEEYDSGSENPSQGSTSQATDVILPKSKGADYAHLIDEAKSQSQSNYSPENFPSFDDVLDDFNQGMGSLLSVRGQSILSWTSDDNFIVENKGTANHEASFLSLNLHTLAEQIAKADISQRLFIDTDLLPPELFMEELQASFEEESGLGEATCGEKAIKNDSEALASHGPSGNKNADEHCEVTSSNSISRSHPVSIDASKGSTLMNQARDEARQLGGTDQSTLLNSTAELNVNSVVKQKNNPPRFVAAAVEAELDMLLDSFNETKFLDSSGFTEKSSYASYVPKEETSASSLEALSSIQLVPALPMKEGPDLSKSAMMDANLDDTIDDLLKETSNVIEQNDTLWSNEVKTTPIDTLSSPSSHPVSKSKLLDDFDSWLDTI